MRSCRRGTSSVQFVQDFEVERALGHQLLQVLPCLRPPRPTFIDDLRQRRRDRVLLGGGPQRSRSFLEQLIRYVDQRLRHNSPPVTEGYLRHAGISTGHRDTPRHPHVSIILWTREVLAMKRARVSGVEHARDAFDPRDKASSGSYASMSAITSSDTSKLA